jgi:hypothetical protein
MGAESSSRLSSNFTRGKDLSGIGGLTILFGIESASTLSKVEGRVL